MMLRPIRILSLAGILLAGAGGAALAQTGGTNPGHAPGMTEPAPSVDTHGAGAILNRADGTQGRNATDPTVPGTTGTIPPEPKAAIGAGVSGRNTCYPGQSGKPVGSSNPAGMASRC